MSRNDADLQRWLLTIKEVEHRVTSSSLENDSLRNDKSDLESEVQTLKADNSALNSEKAQMRCDLERIRAQRERFHQELEACKKKHSSLLHETNDLHDKLNVQDKRLQLVQTERAENLQQALVFRSVNEASKAAIELKDERIQELEAKILRTEQEKNALSFNCEQSRTTVVELRKERTERVDMFHRLEAYSNELKERIGTYEADVEDSKAVLKVRDGEVVRLQSELDKVAKQFMDMRKKHVGQQYQLKAAEEMVKELQAKQEPSPMGRKPSLQVKVQNDGEENTDDRSPILTPTAPRPPLGPPPVREAFPVQKHPDVGSRKRARSNSIKIQSDEDEKKPSKRPVSYTATAPKPSAISNAVPDRKSSMVETCKRPKTDGEDCPFAHHKPVCRSCLQERKMCSSFGQCRNCYRDDAECVYTSCFRGLNCKVSGCSLFHPKQWKGIEPGNWRVV